ncbi:uncharacterized protein TNCV_1019551 [Trichonephila clavipes]|nr:uncharacterized protein TNCV_1019551 [Trichonephila clavipes]
MTTACLTRPVQVSGGSSMMGHVLLEWKWSSGIPRGCDLPNPSSTVLTHTEIHSFQRNTMNLTWRNHPAHHWYATKSPGLSIQCRSSRSHQTALARFRSGHLRSMIFVQGVKSCTNLPVPALSLLLLLIFWTARAFPCDSCMKSKAWWGRLLRGMVKWTWCRLSCSKELETATTTTISNYMVHHHIG